MSLSLCERIAIQFLVERAVYGRWATRQEIAQEYMDKSFYSSDIGTVATRMKRICQKTGDDAIVVSKNGKEIIYRANIEKLIEKGYIYQYYAGMHFYGLTESYSPRHGRCII